MGNNEKISINEFISVYKNNNSSVVQKGLLEKYIKQKYCPIIDKQRILKLMLDKSIVEKNGIKYIDEFVYMINYSIGIMILYTNIVPNKNENGNYDSFEAYDLMSEHSLLDSIYSCIDYKEKNELVRVSDSLRTNFEKENSFISQIGSHISKLGTIVEVLSDEKVNKITDVFENKESINRMITLLKK